MTLIRSLTLTTALLAAITTQSHADDADFVGTWTGDITTLVELDGEVVNAPRHYTIVIESAGPGLVRGVKHWTSKDGTPGDVAGSEVVEADEPLIGAVDADDPVLRLVEVEDSGTLTCELLGADYLEVTYIEPYPHAVVGTAVLHRQPD